MLEAFSSNIIFAEFTRSTSSSLTSLSFVAHFPFFCFLVRVKHRPSDRLSRPVVDTAPPHHPSEVKTTRLPTLVEEESPGVKRADPVPSVREEADGKDAAAEVGVHRT